MLAAWISLIFNHCFHSEHALCKVYLSTKRWAGPSLSGRLDPVLSERLNSRKASFPPRPLKKTGLGLVNRLQSSKTADWAEVNFLILMFETLAKNSPNAARWYCTSRFIKEFENYYHIPAFCCSEQRWWRWFPNSLHELCPKKTCLPFVFCLFGESHVNISNMCLKWYLLKNVLTIFQRCEDTLAGQTGQSSFVASTTKQWYYSKASTVFQQKWV